MVMRCRLFARALIERTSPRSVTMPVNINEPRVPDAVQRATLHRRSGTPVACSATAGPRVCAATLRVAARPGNANTYAAASSRLPPVMFERVDSELFRTEHAHAFDQRVELHAGERIEAVGADRDGAAQQRHLVDHAGRG